MHFLSKAFSHGRFTHSRVSHENRIVLSSSAENLHGTVKLQLSPDQRVQFSHGCTLDKIGRKRLQRINFFLLFTFIGFTLLILRFSERIF